MYHGIDDEHIQMGNEEVQSKFVDKESINLQFTSYKNITLVNVLHVPDMNINFVSGDLLGKSRIKSTYRGGEYFSSKFNIFL